MDTPVRSQKALSEPTQVSASKRIMSKVERRIRWKGIVAQPEVRMREDNSSAQKDSLTLCCIDQAFGWFLLSGPWELCTQRLDSCDIPVWNGTLLNSRVASAFGWKVGCPHQPLVKLPQYRKGIGDVGCIDRFTCCR
jgi:hypothetical protein